MVDIVGYNKLESKDGKRYAIIYYKTDKKVTSGSEYGSVIYSDEYADKLISYSISGGALGKGWSSKKKREFLYIPKKEG